MVLLLTVLLTSQYAGNWFLLLRFLRSFFPRAHPVCSTSSFLPRNSLRPGSAGGAAGPSPARRSHGAGVPGVLRAGDPQAGRKIRLREMVYQNYPPSPSFGLS